MTTFTMRSRILLMTQQMAVEYLHTLPVQALKHSKVFLMRSFTVILSPHFSSSLFYLRLQRDYKVYIHPVLN